MSNRIVNISSFDRARRWSMPFHNDPFPSKGLKPDASYQLGTLSKHIWEEIMD